MVPRGAALLIGGEPDPSVRALITTFVRVVDKAILEYQSAREAFLIYGSSREALHIGALSRGTSHLECCVTNAHRAFTCLHVLKQQQQSPTVDRTTRLLAESMSDAVREARHLIEHVTGEIMKPTGRWHAPGLTDTGALEVGNVSIPTAQLASALRVLWKIADSLA